MTTQNRSLFATLVLALLLTQVRLQRYSGNRIDLLYMVALEDMQTSEIFGFFKAQILKKKVAHERFMKVHELFASIAVSREQMTLITK